MALLLTRAFFASKIFSCYSSSSAKEQSFSFFPRMNTYRWIFLAFPLLLFPCSFVFSLLPFSLLLFSFLPLIFFLFSHLLYPSTLFFLNSRSRVLRSLVRSEHSKLHRARADVWRVLFCDVYRLRRNNFFARHTGIWLFRPLFFPRTFLRDYFVEGEKADGGCTDNETS